MPLPSALRERLERCSSLPSLPSVAIRVLELCQQDDLDLNQIAGVISNDPALAAKLVKTANSPLFALRREVTTIPFAISVLGINAVRTLVLSFSLAKECRAGSRPGLTDYWHRSVLSALAARELCQGAHLGCREEAFLCGLLQDIGMLALARAVGRPYTEILERSARDHDKLIEMERQAFGGDHAQVGAWLLERWHTPRLLAHVVEASHEPESIDLGGTADGRDRLRFLAGVVALSGRFADQWAGDRKLAPSRLFEQIARRWPNGSINVEAMNARLVEQAPHLVPLFEVKLDAAEMSAVLEQAQEVLLSLSVRASLELNDVHEALARLESRTAILLAEAQRDPLTGVANRGYTTTYLHDVFKAAVESRRLVGTIFADIDHFKQVNDTFGHAAGDAVLQSVVQCITRSVRGGDFVGRYGGEEFVIVLRADNPEELAVVAERICHNVAQMRHSIGGGRTVSVTISLGCALLDTLRHHTAGHLLEDADRALYAAKGAGRNQFQMSGAVRI